jgi:hypothetical protein
VIHSPLGRPADRADSRPGPIVQAATFVDGQELISPKRLGDDLLHLTGVELLDFLTQGARGHAIPFEP